MSDAIYDVGFANIYSKQGRLNNVNNFITGTSMEDARLALTDAKNDITQDTTIENSELTYLLKNDFGSTLYFDHETWSVLNQNYC